MPVAGSLSGFRRPAGPKFFSVVSEVISTSTWNEVSEVLQSICRRALEDFHRAIDEEEAKEQWTKLVMTRIKNERMVAQDQWKMMLNI